MSNTVTHIAKRRVIGSSARKAVLMYMADNASDDGTGIWTSKSNMAMDLEMSRRTVQAHIAAMVEMGVVFVAGKRDCKNGYTIEYGIDLDALARMPCTRAGDAPVQEMHGNPRRRCTPTRAGDAHKPPIEPPIEPPFSQVQAKSAQKRRNPKVPLPEDWHPDLGKAQRLMADLDLSRDEMNYCFQRMKDHAHATDRRQVNWDSAFANWVRKAANDADIGPGARSRRVAGSVKTAFDF